MVISQKAKNIFNRLYIWCVADNFIVNYDSLVIIMFVGAQCLPVRVRTQTGIVPSPYYYLISPVGTMSTCACTHADRHRAPTLPFCLLFGLQPHYYNIKIRITQFKVLFDQFGYRYYFYACSNQFRNHPL
jgi:hypothetical protein